MTGETLPQRSRRLPVLLLAAHALVLLLMVLLCGLSLLDTREMLRERALETSASLVDGLQAEVATAIDRVDLMLQVIAAEHRRAPAPAVDETERRLRQWRTMLPEVVGLRIADADGTVRLGEGVDPAALVNVADRDYFVRAREQADGGAVLAGPLLARINRSWVLTLARRLARPDGGFDGVVYANLPVEGFASMLERAHLGPRGAATLRTINLALVARTADAGAPAAEVGSTAAAPLLQAAVSRNARAGRFIGLSGVDEVERAYAYQRVGRWPLLVQVGQATDDFMRPWRRELALVLLLLALVAALLGASGHMVLRGWRGELQARRALQREGHRQRALLQAASDGVHVLDREGRLVELSEAFAAMLGHARAELLGRSAEFWQPQFEGSALAQALRQPTPGLRVACHAQFLRRDGRLIDVEVVGVGARIEHEDLLYCSARDITERRRAERALRASEAFLDRTGRVAAVGGWEYDLREERLRWTDQTCRIHGVPLGFQPTVKEALDFYVPADRARLEAAIGAGLRDGEAWDLEAQLITATGRRIWVRAIGEAVTEDGVTVRLVGALQDITESQRRKDELRHEQQLRSQVEQHVAELDLLLRERSEMLDVLAHEVRQPLNNASAALQAARASLAEVHAAAGTETAAHRLARAQGVMGQVLARIDNTLAVAALLARPEPIELQDVEIDTVVAVSIADMPAAERGRIRIERASDMRTAPMDMGLMRLALRNLLANALRYSPPGSPVTLRIADAEAPPALIVEVSDDGPGVDPEIVPRLFERGTRGGRHAHLAGHGLGLYIVRRVMELHGGSAELAANGEAAAEAAGGATMRLTLPVAPG